MTPYMHIRPQTLKMIQIFLLVLLVASATRVGIIYYHRHSAVTNAADRGPVKLNPDYYVNPRKLHAYDIASAQALEKQPVWVRDGYRYPYYPWDARRKHADFSTDSGLLLPLEQLRITDVAQDRIGGSGGQPVMAIFAKDGKPFAFQIGVTQDSDMQIYSDEVLYLDDPAQLYHHWPREVWQAIRQHEVKPGMNELQATFAVGFGVPLGSSAGTSRIVNYPNGGKPLTVIYQGGKAAEIKAGPSI